MIIHYGMFLIAVSCGQCINWKPTITFGVSDAEINEGNIIFIENMTFSSR